MKKHVAHSSVQTDKFVFSCENLEKVEQILARYPSSHKRSAVLPLLHLVQEQNENWIPIAAMDYIAQLLDMPVIRVYEVASFYSMFNTAPVGKYLIQVCRTTPCWLRGADRICNAIAKELSIRVGQSTEDGKFSLVEVECLGACVNAPVIQINNDYFEELDEKSVIRLISKLK
ncbi:NADH-quinone oxidoreductase, E subunit [Neorickettsia helminthoeca str. Oregon]|uniref:NADH-quinone oxidoreductase subunit E n=1 Tax=Neorickettsia helminthoeca str. Oregon TaxID=1286528 RepID=X5HKH8_9RICK|nr:NADH-quinone oxidoreductase subunit NuoE [Neorickettsia helminthoeca]AHX11544.1 NADH-quinone oxidoreductase, E subunit [Neorickettsia helminthoeca str. Oregon]